MEQESKITVELSRDEAHLIVMSIDAGLITMNSFQATLTNCFFDTENEQRQRELMVRMNDAKNVIYDAIVKVNKSHG